jgi:N-acetylneuraminic acid mutarotase
MVQKIGNPKTNEGGVRLAMKYQTSEWLRRPPLSTARVGLAGATANGHIYAISGFEEHEFVSVEVRSRLGDPTWHPAPALTTPRGNSAADTVDHLIYVVGGIRNNTALPSVERFDSRTNGPWRASLDLPEPRAQAGVAAHRKLLYVAGGALEDGVTRSMVAYDVDNDRWIDRTPLPGPRRFLLRLLEAGGHLYAIGGFDIDNQAQTVVDRYDPAHNRWERMAPLNEARGNCGVATFGRGRRHIVAVGGLDRFGGGTLSRTSEVYDIDANEWGTLNVQLAHGRGSLVCALENRNTVLAIGGGVRKDDGTSAPAGLVEALHIRLLGDDDHDQDEDEDGDQEDN